MAAYYNNGLTWLIRDFIVMINYCVFNTRKKMKASSNSEVGLECDGINTDYGIGWT